MRSLITGIGGFAGGHLAKELRRRGDAVAGIDLQSGPQIEPLLDDITFATGDIRDGHSLERLAGDFRPDVIFHLAAVTHVGDSFDRAAETLAINVGGTEAVVAVATARDTPPKLILASSGQVYDLASVDDRPLREGDPVGPQSPYAESKVRSEDVVRAAAAEKGLNVVILRTFNYTGPWQAPSFVVSDFAHQIAWAEAGLAEPVMSVGSLESRRDFSDVRDIVDGYLLAAAGDTAEPAYNLASGKAVPIGDILEHLRGAAKVEIDVQTNPDRLRKIDPAALEGDAGLARRELGWTPRFSLAETLDSVLKFWRQKAQEEL